jgi:hypothetical protein
MNVVYTRAQSQAVIDDARPWWWYSYTLTKDSVSMRPGGRFVPYFGIDMDCGGPSVTITPFDQTHIDLAVANAGDDGYIMFSGELNIGGACPTTVGGGAGLTQQINNWNTLAADAGVIAHHIKLVSPRLSGNASAGDVLAQFIAGVTRKPDALAVDCYGTTDVPTAFNGILNCIGSYINVYGHKYPFWITEWGFNVSVNPPTDQQVSDLMDLVIPNFEHRPDIQMYSWWYAGPATISASTSFPNRSLYDDSGNARAIGTHYKLFASP